MENRKWGLYPWFAEHGTEMIYPEDLEAFRREAHNCKVFECVDEGGYITLRYYGRYYRVREELFCPVPAPKFHFGQRVLIVKHNEEVVITDIMWHRDRRQHYYFVAFRKRKARRYFESELESVGI